MTPRLLLPGLALTLAALLAPVASANADAGGTLVGRGLHISTGSLVDPSGRTWVADHNAGFCRMSEPSETSAGRIEHPERPSDQDSPRTCLGGLLPDAGTGPDAAGQPTLVDPTPAKRGNGDEVALIPDGASPSSDVVRARWEPGSGRPGSGHFEFLDTVTMVQADVDKGSRPMATTLGPDGNVYVTFQRENTIQRIVDPAGDAPRAQVVGTPADGRGPAAIAAGGTAANPVVYVAETTGLRELSPNPVTRPQTRPSFDLGTVNIASLAYDQARGVLWAGTADGVAAQDDLVRVDTATRDGHDARQRLLDDRRRRRPSGQPGRRARRPGAARSRRAARNRPDVPRRSSCRPCRRPGRPDQGHHPRLHRDGRRQARVPAVRSGPWRCAVERLRRRWRLPGRAHARRRQLHAVRPRDCKRRDRPARGDAVRRRHRGPDQADHRPPR